MTDRSSATETPPKRNYFGVLLLPLAFFPLLALVSYDWRVRPELLVPAEPTANWIGAVGDAFAYYGYLFFGFAIWLVPVFCVIAAFAVVLGTRMRPLRREFAFACTLVSASCLMQVLSHRAPALASLCASVNCSFPGGALGYLAMDRALCPILSDFGAAVVVIVALAAAFVAAVGVHNLSAAAMAALRWALPGRNAAPPSEPPPNATSEEMAAFEAEKAKFEAIQAAREEVKRQKEEDKRRAAEEKQRAAEEKQRAKEEKLRAKQEAAAARNAGRAEPEPTAQDTPPPVRKATPAKAPAKKATAEEPPAEDKGPYVLPPVSLLNPLKKVEADHGDAAETSQRLVDTLKLFGVDATVAYTVQGPVVTKYAISLRPGTRFSAVTNISDNLMGALQAKSLRIEAPIPGENHVGVEVPNRAPAGISFREIFESDAWKNCRGELPLLFGKDAAGRELVADLAKMPHMLVAGATGQGKSVCLNAIINGLLMTKTPEQLKLIMVDPKSVEFTSYSSIPHLIVPIITENRKAATSLAWAVGEMEKRLKLFTRAKVKNIYDFNHRLQFTQTDMFGQDTEVGSNMPRTVPYIVIIIDEVADLMSQCAKEVVPHISRLTAKARAAGIHLILATQRPDAKVITGTIKANIPGRVAFKTATSIDSRTILDDSGAENLIGRGDMLFKAADGILLRAQGAWITDQEIDRITKFIEEHSTTQFDNKFKENLERIKDAEIDPFAELNEGDNAAEAKAKAEAERAQVKADAAADDFKKAVECVINTGRASTSHFQRQMGWGYNHAAKILDELTRRGIVSPQSGMGPRQIIMNEQELLAVFNECSDGNGNADEVQEPASDEGETTLTENEGEA